MSKLHGLARVMKRAQNENALGTPAIEVCTPASGSMAPGKGAGASTSSMVGVIVISAAATATASSGTLVCFYAFPVSCAIGDSYEITIIIYRHRKNRLRNRAQPLRSSSPAACSPRQWPQKAARRSRSCPTSLCSSQKSARTDGRPCTVALS